MASHKANFSQHFARFHWWYRQPTMLASQCTDQELLFWCRTPTTTNPTSVYRQPAYHESEYWGFRRLCCCITHNDTHATTAEVPEEAVCASMATKKARQEHLHQCFHKNSWCWTHIPWSLTRSMCLYRACTLKQDCQGSVLHLNSLFTSCQAWTPPSIPSQSVECYK